MNVDISSTGDVAVGEKKIVATVVKQVGVQTIPALMSAQQWSVSADAYKGLCLTQGYRIRNQPQTRLLG